MRQFTVIGQRRFETAYSGQGSPTVVFESGAGRTVSDWNTVRSHLDSQISIFAYSRAGQGESDPPRPEDVIFDDGGIQVATAESRTEDLAQLLRANGQQPPYVLVGHSLGGIYIRLFAAKYPESVAGLIFVDSTHPDQTKRISDAVAASTVSSDTRERFFESVPGPNEPVISAARETGLFGDIPVRVLSRDPDRPYGSTEFWPMDMHRVYEQTWSELQAELAILSSNGVQTVVKGADHLVQLHAPELVAEAINEVISQHRVD